MGELRVRESCRQGLRKESRSVWRKPETGHGRTGRAWAEGTLIVAIQETSQLKNLLVQGAVLERAAIAMTEVGTTGERSATVERTWPRTGGEEAGDYEAEE
jgi:hypothetical protein